MVLIFLMSDTIGYVIKYLIKSVNHVWIWLIHVSLTYIWDWCSEIMRILAELWEVSKPSLLSVALNLTIKWLTMRWDSVIKYMHVQLKVLLLQCTIFNLEKFPVRNAFSMKVWLAKCSICFYALMYMMFKCEQSLTLTIKKATLGIIFGYLRILRHL